MTTQHTPTSLLRGGPIADLPDWFGAAEALARAAHEAPDVALHFYDAAGTHERTTYAALFEDAHRAAVWFDDAGLRRGDPLVLQCSDQHEMLRYFWACLITGVVAVPVGETDGIVDQALNMLDGGRVLVGHRDRARHKGAAPVVNGRPTHILWSPDTVDQLPPSRWFASPGRDAVAAVFLTSGSTGVPKGVVQTHDAVICREAGVVELCDFACDTQLNWMPLDHAAGMLMAHFRGTYLLSEQVQVATEHILAEPLRWLDLIDAHRVAYTWAPQFAYTLLRDFTAGIEPRWDLTCVRHLLDGGEMVNREVLAQLARQLAPCGLAPTAFLPVWGMAETCSGVVYHTSFDAAVDGDLAASVPLGGPIPGVDVAVVDETWRPVPVGDTGRLVVRGRAVLREYHANAAANAEAFGPDGWFRTGDLAHVVDGTVVMTGRDKQVLIVNGLNLDPSEVESVIEELAHVEPSHTAVWAQSRTGAGDEVVVCYVPRGEAFHPAHIDAIRTHLGRRLGLRPHRVVPVRRSGIPRTNLGKKQRSRLARSLADGTLDEYRLDAAGEERIPEQVRAALHDRFGDLPLTVRTHVTGSRAVRLGGELVPLDTAGGTWLADVGIEAELAGAVGVRAARVWTSDDLPAGLTGVLVAVEPSPAWESISDAVHERVAQVLRPHGFALSDVQLVADAAACDESWLEAALTSTSGAAGSRRAGVPSRTIHTDTLLPSPGDVVEPAPDAGVPLIVLADDAQPVLTLLDDTSVPVTVVRTRAEDAEAQVLRAAGARVVHIDLRAPSPFDAVVAEAGDTVLLVDLWPAEPGAAHCTQDTDVAWNEQMRGVAGLGEALRSFAQRGVQVRRALIVTRDALGIGTPGAGTHHAGVSTFVRAALAEGHPLSHVDLRDGDDVAQTVQAELLLRPEASSIVTVAGRRHVQAVRQAELMAPGKVAAQRLAAGLVVVVGGTGGIGQWLVTVLLARYGADVLVLGRRPQGQVEGVLDDLRRRAGDRGSLRYARVDLGDAAALDIAVAAELAGGPLAGVFHLAGSIDEVLVTDTTVKRTRADYGAKIAAVLHIGGLVTRHPGAFLAVFGSARGLAPGATVSSYVAGNEHAVRYAAYLRKHGVLAVGISWGVWHEIGMSKGLAVKSALARRGLTAFDVLEGVNALLGALECDLGHLYYGIEERDLDFPSVPGPRRPAVRVITDVATMDKLAARSDEVRTVVEAAGGLDHVIDVLDALPRDRHGTVDDALVDTRADVLRGTVRMEPPATEAEERVLEACASIFGVTAIGVTENLFDLGADSITVMRLLGRIRDQLGLNVNHEEFYRHPTVRTLAAIAQRTEPTAAVRLEAPGGRHPLTPQQRRQWVLYQLNPASAYYNNTIAVTVRGTIVEPCLKTALVALIERHEILRTRYAMDGAHPYQQVLPMSEVRLDVPVYDLRDMPEPARQERVDQLLDASGAQPLDLVGRLPLRVVIVRTASAEAVLAITIHHIASDGWSMRVILDELSRLYDDILAYGTSRLPALATQYCHQAAAIADLEQTDAYRDQLTHWLTELGGQVAPSPLPTDSRLVGPGVAPPTQDHQAGGHLTVTLDSTVTSRLKTLARELDASLYVVTLAAYAVLHARLTGDDHVRVGTLIAGRHRSGTEPLVGFFVNTLPVDLTLTETTTVRELVELVKTKTVAMHDNQDVQFDTLVDAVQPERIADSTPLFQVLFVLQNAQLERTQGREAEWHLEIRENNTAKFDLSVQVFERSGTVDVVFEHRTSVLGGETVARWGRAYAQVLDGFCSKPDAHVAEIDVVGDETGAMLFATGGDGALPSSLGAALAATVRDYGEHTALTKDGSAITYAQLWERAGRYAGFLAAHGVRRGSRVAVVARRMPAVIVALVALVRLGAVYVPLRPTDPDARQAAIVADSGATVLLDSTGEIRAGLVPLPLDDDSHAAPSNAEVTADDPVYVMYTSGSTGAPKGVVVTHENVLRLVHRPQFVTLGSDDVILQTGSLTFDASTFEVWGAFLAGARLHLVDDAIIVDAHALGQEVARSGASVMWLSAPLFHQIVDSDPAVLTGVRDLVVGGDVVSPRHVRAALDASPGLSVINGYGPTENTTFSTTYRIPESFPLDRPLPIGTPIQRSTAYVLSPGLRPQPIGVVGELYVGGCGVAQGYLGRDDLTAERFRPDPFIPGGRMYRTGDLARIGTDGQLEFVGRRDHQVKVRGFRVELGEIELALRSLNGVRDAAVRALPGLDGRVRLVAYHCGPRNDGLRADLERLLPDYAVPSRFIHLERLPLDRNGKIDRARLPEPNDAPDQEVGAAYPSPAEDGASDTIAVVRRVWAALLGRARFADDDSFFALGGDSIQVIQMTNELRRNGFAITARDVFTHQSVAALAQVLRPAEEHVPVPPGTARTSTSQLGPAQHWLLSGADASSNWLAHWNLPVAVPVGSATTRDAVAAAVGQLVARHRILSARFTHNGEHWRFLLPDGPGPAPEVAEFVVGRIEEATQALTRLQASLDLDAGHLLAVALVRADEGTFVLLAPHHLVSDGVSLRILADELVRSLAGQDEHGSPSNGMEAWIAALNRATQLSELAAQAPYWADIVARVDNRLSLAAAPTYGTGTDVVRVTSPELTAQLSGADTTISGAELQHVLLAALALAWTAAFGGEDLPVLLEGHGRTHADLDVDVSGEVGWFTAIYPAVIPVPADRDPVAAVLAVRDHLRAVPHDGIDYGVLRYLVDDGERLACAPPVAFNYLGVVPHGLRFADPQFGVFRSPGSPRSCPIELNVLQENGALRVVWTVDNSLAATDLEVAALVDGFDAALATLGTKLVGEQGRVYSASDFDLADLDEESLNVVRGRFGRRVHDILPLTPGQEGLLYHGLITGRDDYFGQVSTTLTGKLDVRAFERAWRIVVARHDILRTVYLWEQLPRPVQVVLDDLPLSVTYNDLTTSADDTDSQARAILAADIAAGFDLTSGPLLRVRLCRINEDEHLFVLSFPHLSLDGWSVFHILDEVLQHYDHEVGAPQKSGTAPVDGIGPELPRPGFGGYVRWLATHDTEADRQFWRGYLAGVRNTKLLPAEARGTDPEGAFAQSQITLDAAETRALEAFAARAECTLGTVLQAGLTIALRLVSSRDEVVFGVTVSGRTADLSGIEHIAGLLISTVPLRIAVPPELPVHHLVRRVQADVFETVTHSALSTTEIAECADLAPGQELFDVALIVENYPLGPEVLRSAALEIGQFASHERTSFSLTVVAVPGDELVLRVSTTTDQVNPKWAASFGATLHKALLQITEGRETVADIDAAANSPSTGERTRVSCQYEDQHALFEAFTGRVLVLSEDGRPCPPGMRGRVHLAADTLDGLPLDEATAAWMTGRARSAAGSGAATLYPTGDFGLVEADASVTLVD